MKRFKALLLTLAMTAGLLVLLVGLRGQYARLAAALWLGQLKTVPDDRARILLRQVAELGEPGIPVLVEALGSERESVAQAGKQALAEELDRWQMLRASASSPKLAVLADALAERVERFGPTARNDAADLATRILLWPLDCRAVDRRQVIASCERVFQATTVRGGVLLDGSLALRPAPRVEPADARIRPQRPTAADDPVEPGRWLGDLSRLPGGGLPIDSLPQAGAPPQQAATALLGDARAKIPRRLAPPPAARPLGAWQQPDGHSAVGQQPGTGPDSTAPSKQSPPEPHPSRTLSATEREDATRRGPSGNFSEMETVQLMQWLDCREEWKATEARAELMRRGFTEVHLGLARRLFDPDPEVRKRLARLLPAMQSVDAAPWLLWLSRDRDPEVRLVAIGLLATSGDAELLEQIEQTARADPDPQIQRQAELMAARRDKQRH
jgi:hypothetical protein